MQHPFQALAYPLPRSKQQIRSRIMRGVAVARENSQQHIGANGAHGPVSRLIGSLRGGPRTSWLPRRAPRRSSCQHNSDSCRRPWSASQSLCKQASPRALPVASFEAPFASLIEPATLFSSMAARSPCLSRRRLMALGSKSFASGIGTLGQRFERRQPRKLLSPGRACRRRRIERLDRMSARRRRVRRSRLCSCQARSTFVERTSSLASGLAGFRNASATTRGVCASAWNPMDRCT